MAVVRGEEPKRPAKVAGGSRPKKRAKIEEAEATNDIVTGFAEESVAAAKPKRARKKSVRATEGDDDDDEDVEEEPTSKSRKRSRPSSSKKSDGRPEKRQKVSQTREAPAEGVRRGGRTKTEARYYEPTEADFEEYDAAVVTAAAPRKRDANKQRHGDSCNLCGDAGELVLCGTCNKAFHITCADLVDVPPSPWSCAFCTGLCEVCLTPTPDESARLACSRCWASYHTSCAPCVEPGGKAPSGGADWKCYLCKRHPETIESILTFRSAAVEDKIANVRQRVRKERAAELRQQRDEIGSVEIPRAKTKTSQPKPGQNTRSLATAAAGEGVDNMLVDGMTEYFVQFEGRSYHDCAWVPESWLNKVSRQKLATFKMKFGVVPPVMSEVVRPEYLEVQRIVGARTYRGRQQYMIKWKGLGYDHCTWEEADREFLDPKEVDRYEKFQSTDIQAVDKEARKKKFVEYRKQPDFIPFPLHEYQLTGLNWLLYCWHKDVNCILADEMGLGKTIQAVSFMRTLVQSGRSPGPFLVLGPLSTIPNWAREFEKWAPDLNVIVYRGNAEARQLIREREMYRDGRLIFNVLLTSYEMILSDAPQLRAVHWECMVVDEGHRLKNQESKLFQLLVTFKVNHRVLLTGTPLQNNLEELYNLLVFLGLCRDQTYEQFNGQYASIEEQATISNLHDMLRPHMLRRVKEDVIKSIPPKAAFIVPVDMTPIQREFYKNVLAKNFSVLGKDGRVTKLALNNVIMQLQKVCNHPYLFPEAEPQSASRADEYTRLVDASGKLTVLDKMLAKLLPEGHRVLIFSQSTRMLDILEDYMRHKLYNYERLDGTIKSQDRQRSIDRFNAPSSPVFCFLLSTRAARLGINLATADTVVIYDSDWNPHNDLQAIARAHRLGQTKKVMIYQMVTRASIEEKVQAKAMSKLMLEHLVVKKMDEELRDGELDDILRTGTEELFAEEGMTPEEIAARRLVYDDAAIDRLLDRTQETSTDEGDKGAGKGLGGATKNTLFASLNVWKGANEAGGDAGSESEGEGDRASEADGAERPDRASAEGFDEDDGAAAADDTERSATYWNALLAKRVAELEEAEANAMGRGKRSRRAVSYNESQFIVTPFGDDDEDGRLLRAGRKRKRDDSPDADEEWGEDGSDDGSAGGASINAIYSRTDYLRAQEVLMRQLVKAYGPKQFAVHPDGMYHCFFPGCPVKMSDNYANHLVAHEERKTPGVTPVIPVDPERDRKPVNFPFNRQKRAYGAGQFTKGGDRRYACFFKGCRGRFKTKFSKHIQNHELLGDATDGERLHVAPPEVAPTSPVLSASAHVASIAAGPAPVSAHAVKREAKTPGGAGESAAPSEAMRQLIAQKQLLQAKMAERRPEGIDLTGPERARPAAAGSAPGGAARSLYPFSAEGKAEARQALARQHQQEAAHRAQQQAQAQAQHDYLTMMAYQQQAGIGNVIAMLQAQAMQNSMAAAMGDPQKHYVQQQAERFSHMSTDELQRQLHQWVPDLDVMRAGSSHEQLAWLAALHAPR